MNTVSLRPDLFHQSINQSSGLISCQTVGVPPDLCTICVMSSSPAADHRSRVAFFSLHASIGTERSFQRAHSRDHWCVRGTMGHNLVVRASLSDDFSVFIFVAGVRVCLHSSRAQFYECVHQCHQTRPTLIFSNPVTPFCY